MGQPLPPKRAVWFVARYDFDCATCLIEIFEGDDAAYVGDEVNCERCAQLWESSI